MVNLLDSVPPGTPPSKSLRLQLSQKNRVIDCWRRRRRPYFLILISVKKLQAKPRWITHLLPCNHIHGELPTDFGLVASTDCWVNCRLLLDAPVFVSSSRWRAAEERCEMKSCWRETEKRDEEEKRDQDEERCEMREVLKKKNDRYCTQPVLNRVTLSN